MHKNLNKKLFFITLIIYFLIFSIKFSSAAPSATIVEDFFGFGYSQQTYEPPGNLSVEDIQLISHIEDHKYEIWEKPDHHNEVFDYYVFYTFEDNRDKFFKLNKKVGDYVKYGLHEKLKSWGNEAFANMWHPEIRGDILRLNPAKLVFAQILVNQGKAQKFHRDDYLFAGLWMIKRDQMGTIIIKPQFQVNVKPFIGKRSNTIEAIFYTSENTNTFRIQPGIQVDYMGGVSLAHAAPEAGPDRSAFAAGWKYNGEEEELTKFYFLKLIEQMEINKDEGLTLTKSILRGEFSENNITFENIKTEKQLVRFARGVFKKNLNEEQIDEIKKIAKGLIDRSKSRYENTKFGPSESFFEILFGCSLDEI